MIEEKLNPTDSNVLNMAQDNAWFPIKERLPSFNLGCTGWHFMEHLYATDDQSFTIQMQLRKDHWQPGLYCDSELL